jgi:hypothetical protein
MESLYYKHIMRVIGMFFDSLQPKSSAFIYRILKLLIA